MICIEPLQITTSKREKRNPFIVEYFMVSVIVITRMPFELNF